MPIRKYLAGIVFIVGMIPLSPDLLPAASDLSDEQKKTIIYEMYEGYKADFPGVKDIAPPAAMQLVDRNAVVFVDVRKKDEMAVSMLPNAISETAFLTDVAASPSKFKGKTVIAYCTISYRSGKFAEAMQKKGIAVYNLTGGILAWVHEGGQVVDENGPTTRIHVYGKKWDYPPAGYESIKFGMFDRVFTSD